MKNSKINKFTDEEFAEIVKTSEFMRDVNIKLGYGKNCGSMIKYIKKRILDLELDDRHLGIGKGTIKYRGSKNGNNSKIPLSKILISNSTYQNGNHLKKRLIKEKILDNKCSICSCEPLWNNLPLTLSMDHINGNNSDNRIENLRILCPNCHAQTATYGSKNRAYKNK